MRQFARFYGACLKRSLPTVWFLIGLGSTLLTYGVVYAVNKLQWIDTESMNNVIAALPVLFLAFCLLILPLIHAFRMYQAKEVELAAEREQRANDNRQHEGHVAELKRQRDEKPADVLDILGRVREFAREASPLTRSTATSSRDCQAWYDRAQRFVRAAFRPHYAEGFEAPWGVNLHGPIQSRVQDCMNWLNTQREESVRENRNPRFTESMLADHPASTLS